MLCRCVCVCVCVCVYIYIIYLYLVEVTQPDVLRKTEQTTRFTKEILVNV